MLIYCDRGSSLKTSNEVQKKNLVDLLNFQAGRTSLPQDREKTKIFAQYLS